jgi:hypothetical protein
MYGDRLIDVPLFEHCFPNSGMESRAFAMFSGAVLICLLDDFWILPGAGEAVGARGVGAVVGAESFGSTGT